MTSIVLSGASAQIRAAAMAQKTPATVSAAPLPFETQSGPSPSAQLTLGKAMEQSPPAKARPAPWTG